jgi:hypothetical protein
MKKINPAYKCTQQEFYAVANLAWQNYQANLADFTAFKAKYTTELGTEAVADLLAAKNIPDAQSRSSVPESLRIELSATARLCLYNFQMLKSYIADAFPEVQQKAMLEAAGSKFYPKASNKSWTAMQSMLDAAKQFITDHTADLEQGGNNMQATFPAKFNLDKNTFETNYAVFIAAEQGSEGGTNDKITANNACYDTLTKMLADGQVIYKNDDAKKALFVFDTLLGYVKAPGATGLRIVAKEKVTELPVAGVAVTAQPGNVQGATDENGVVVLSLSENTYSIIGIKDGYNTFNEEVDITTGTVSRRNVELTKTA